MLKTFPLPLIFIIICACTGVTSEYKQLKNRDDRLEIPTGNFPVYAGESLRNVAFPIGGFGTGDILLGGRGNIIDLEIFGKANRGGAPPYMTFFSIRAKEEGGPADVRIAERQLLNNFPNPFGIPRQQLPGIKRFDEVEFDGRFPYANVTFIDETFPLKISLQGFNPFIPMDVDNSSLPIAEFTWKLKNISENMVDISLCLNMGNPFLSGSHDGSDTNGPVVNEIVQDKGFNGVIMYPDLDTGDYRFGEIFFSTIAPQPEMKTGWYRGRWWDNSHDFWDDFATDGHLENDTSIIINEGGQTTVSSLNVLAELAPGDSLTIPFYISWYMPQRKLEPGMAFDNEEPMEAVAGNYYARGFKGAIDVTSQYLDNRDYLHSRSGEFRDILYGSTLPSHVIDALSCNLAAFKTNLYLRLGNGNVHGYEGLGNNFGCCAGNCAHVWNYAQTMAFLFPSLERNVRTVQFIHDTHENGYFCFRTVYPLGDYWFKSVAADGQLGTIMRAYREWKYSGDDKWLTSIWPKIKAAMAFTWQGSGDLVQKYPWMKNQSIAWDHDKDGLITGRQHNTYDIDFYGANMMTGSLYIGALKACEMMASTLRDETFAAECKDLRLKAQNAYVEQLWNGNYFEQKFDLPPTLQIPADLLYNDSLIKYQFGKGCLSDQLLGQFLAFVSGMGYLLEEDMVQETLESIYEHNFYRETSHLENLQRVYAINDDASLVNCTWPQGGEPLYPFVYATEVWTGVEYQVAASLIYAGQVKEGLNIVKAIRERYRGYNRNPWSEIESGDYYARSQANWAVLLALSGYAYDATTGFLQLQPKVNQQNYSGFWSTGEAWGQFRWSTKELELINYFGKLELKSLKSIPLHGEVEPKAKLNKEPVPHSIQGDTLLFSGAIKLWEGDTLKIIL